MSDREVAKKIMAASTEISGESERMARRREIRAELAKVTNGATVTPRIAALFDELESLSESKVDE